MVTSAELNDDNEYQEIREDVRLECMEHGQVLSLLMPRVRDGYPVHTEGRIYVEFASGDMARRAALALHGRKFGDRTVMVTYVSIYIYV